MWTVVLLSGCVLWVSLLSSVTLGVTQIIWPHRLINHHQLWPVRVSFIMAGLFSGVLVMASSVPTLHHMRHEQVPGIHFIWTETIRKMMINIANPPVCFVPSRRI